MVHEARDHRVLFMGVNHLKSDPKEAVCFKFVNKQVGQILRFFDANKLYKCQISNCKYGVKFNCLI
jgi:hypothetical protein